jgi:hypothetical protein
MRVLVWPYAGQKREIKLYIGVKEIESTVEVYILKFFDGKVVVLEKSYIHKMMVDE